MRPGDLPLPSSFQVAAGGVLGGDHRRGGRNRQDAWGWSQGPEGLVAVVCDGCGSGAHSELGATLAARLFVAAGAQALRATSGLPGPLGLESLLEGLRRKLLEQLAELAEAMTPEPTTSARRKVIAEHFLFTMVGALADAERLVTFSLGDGLVALDGEVLRLGPFPGDAPPYLGYDLLEAGPRLRFRVHHRRPLAEVDTLLLASDGLEDWPGDLDELWSDERVFRNPDFLRRRLVVTQRQGGPGALPDDTTLVVLRRAGEQPAAQSAEALR